MIRQDKNMVKKFAHKISSKSKYLPPQIDTFTKNKIREFPTPFYDNEQIMTGESQLANHVDKSRGLHSAWIFFSVFTL